MLKGLKTTNRDAELLATLGVLDTHLDQLRSAPKSICGQLALLRLVDT